MARNGKSKEPTYRYAIIPARAVTDPDIQPRDLQVLCLLGRHTDANGWCRRSQVRMADELRCGRATIYRALERLVASAYVERRLEGRPGQAVNPDKQPFAAHSYRVRLDLEDVESAENVGDDEGCITNGQCGAHQRAPTETLEKLDDDRVPIDGHQPTNGQGVPAQDGQGVPISRAPIIEHSPLERPLSNTARVARGKGGGNPKESQESNSPPVPKPDKGASAPPDAWGAIWLRFTALPGFSANMSEVQAMQAWLGLRKSADYPGDERFCACIAAYSRWLESENAKRARKHLESHLLTHPHNWIRTRGFKGYLPLIGAVQAKDAALQGQLDAIAKAWGPDAYARLRATGLRDESIAAYFQDTCIDAGPPAVLSVETEFRRRYILDHFITALEREFGDGVCVRIFGQDAKAERAA